MNFFLPRSLEDYRPFIALEPYEAVKVSGTEVAWADYEALARDFPFLTRTARLGDAPERAPARDRARHPGLGDPRQYLRLGLAVLGRS